MASTTFVDNQTIIYASWLNAVNDLTYDGVLPNGIINSTTLALQTGGVNAITIDASQNVTINNLVLSGSLTAPAGLALTGNMTATGYITAGSYITVGGAATITGTMTAGTVTGAKFSPTYGIYENVQTVSDNYTITAGSNGLSAGPITVAPGKTVTIPSGSRWAVV